MSAADQVKRMKKMAFAPLPNGSVRRRVSISVCERLVDVLAEGGIDAAALSEEDDPAVTEYPKAKPAAKPAKKTTSKATKKK